MDNVRRHEAALRAVQKPPAKPWRGATGPAAPPPPPLKVYRVEPREFRDLVQRLTGPPPAPPPTVVVPVTKRLTDAPSHPQMPPVSGDEQQLYASAPPWFTFPMAGMD